MSVTIGARAPRPPRRAAPAGGKGRPASSLAAWTGSPRAGGDARGRGGPEKAGRRAKGEDANVVHDAGRDRATARLPQGDARRRVPRARGAEDEIRPRVAKYSGVIDTAGQAAARGGVYGRRGGKRGRGGGASGRAGAGGLGPGSRQRRGGGRRRRRGLRGRRRAGRGQGRIRASTWAEPSPGRSAFGSWQWDRAARGASPRERQFVPGAGTGSRGQSPARARRVVRPRSGVGRAQGRRGRLRIVPQAADFYGAEAGAPRGAGAAPAGRPASERGRRAFCRSCRAQGPPLPAVRPRPRAADCRGCRAP